MNKKTREIKSDGSLLIEDKLKISDPNDFEQIIKDLDLDPNLWEITSARFSEWDNANTDSDEKLYSTKIALRPKTGTQAFNLDKIIERINNGIQPRESVPLTKQVVVPDSNKNLVVPFYDTHFGNSTLEDYQTTLDKLRNILKDNTYENIVIISGGDILNEDNYNGSTASGTLIGKTDMQTAWLHAFEFFKSIIEMSENRAKKVIVMYVPGNHDTFSGHTVLLALQKYFSNSNVEFDTEQAVYKAIKLGKVFIGCTHGHKSSVSKYPMIMATTFPMLWRTTITRECFTGHLHTEWSSKDDSGIMVRQMPSRNKPDDWHKQLGNTSSHKRFLVVEYTEHEIDTIQYI